MKKNYLKILFLIAFSGFMEAQCIINIVSSVTGGCAPLQVIFNCPTVSSGTVTWTATGSNSTTGSAASMIFPDPGVYTITATAITSAGTCTAITTITVVTGPANGCTTTVGLKENLNSKGLLVYPNPNTGEFTISSTFDLDLTLINELGQRIKFFKLNEINSHKIAVSNIADGIYFIVGEKEEKKLQAKIVVRK